jgi:hypothetical protein
MTATIDPRSDRFAAATCRLLPSKNRTLAYFFDIANLQLRQSIVEIVIIKVHAAKYTDLSISMDQ